MKNLALINGKPLIYYAIEAAKSAQIFDRVVVNSDNEIFAEIAKRYEVDFYLRPSALGSSATKSDSVVYDFMKQNSGDILAWVNPTSPLQTGEEVKAVIEYFLEKNLDSLITVRDEQVHCLYDGKPLNYNPTEVFAQTQDLKPVSRFVYSVMVWRYTTFLEEFEKNDFGLFCGNFGVYQVSKLSSLIVKTEEDLRLIDYILTGREVKGESEIEYDELVNYVTP
jgi:CMP-N-acetylneuraminic acid synthetase